MQLAAAVPGAMGAPDAQAAQVVLHLAEALAAVVDALQLAQNVQVVLVHAALHAQESVKGVLLPAEMTVPAVVQVIALVPVAPAHIIAVVVRVVLDVVAVAAVITVVQVVVIPLVPEVAKVIVLGNALAVMDVVPVEAATVLVALVAIKHVMPAITLKYKRGWF